MRTKTLILTAALSVAGVATSMAQVYSVNAVGYVNTKVPASGFAFINNPLKAPTNTLAALLPTVPENTTLYLFRNGGFVIAVFALDDNNNLNWGDSAGLELDPGEGAVIKNGGASDLTLTFVGDVAQGSLSHATPAGFSLQASEVPQAGALGSVLGYVPTDGDATYQLLPNGTFFIDNYAPDDNNVLNWDQGEPNIGVGEGFWLSRKTAGTWSRTFSVN